LAQERLGEALAATLGVERAGDTVG
jgi:hypothetical protein